MAWEFGMTTGFFEKRGITTASQALGVKIMRTFDIATTETLYTAMDARMTWAADRDVQLLWLINNVTTSGIAVGNLPEFVARYALGGSFWLEHPQYDQYALAPRWIEWGNECSYNYRMTQIGFASQADSAAAMALSLKAAQVAVASHAPNAANIGWLIEGEDAGFQNDNFFNGLVAAVPDIANRVEGLVCHAYYPQNYSFLGRLETRMYNAGGIWRTKGIYLTEGGVSFDPAQAPFNYYGNTTIDTDAEAADWYTTYAGLLDNRPSWAPPIKLWTAFTAYDSSLPNTSTNPENYFGVRGYSSGDTVVGAAKGGNLLTSTIQDIVANHPRQLRSPVVKPVSGRPRPSRAARRGSPFNRK